MTSRGGLPILTYHAIGAHRAATSTDPARFAATLAALREAGWHAVALDEWVKLGRPEVDRGFAVAFDDGCESILDVADVIVRESVPATIFLVADRIGSDNAWPGQPRNIPRARLLGRRDLDALARLGFRLGSHGRTHARLDLLSTAAIERELRGSRDAIEQAFGRPCPLMAYPYGASDARVRAAASRSYGAAFGTRLAYASSGDDAFDIARIDAYYLRSGRALSLLVDGRWRRGLAFRRALRAVRRAVDPARAASSRRPAAPMDRGFL